MKQYLLTILVLITVFLGVVFSPTQAYASSEVMPVGKSTAEKLAETKAIGKRNTEILMLAVTLGLAGLVGVGYVLQNLKKSSSKADKKASEEVVQESKSQTTEKITTKTKTNSVKGKKTLASLFVITIGALKAFTPAAAYAICPVCVVGVGAALGLAEVLHIDDTITGAWIGGMGVATFFWLIDFMNKRHWTFKFKFGTLLRNVILFAVTALTIFFAVEGFITGSLDHTVAGIDKMIVGPLFGALLFTAATQIHYILREKNGGKAYFPFQKVVIPMSSLLVSTIIFYIVIYGS